MKKEMEQKEIEMAEQKKKFQIEKKRTQAIKKEKRKAQLQNTDWKWKRNHTTETIQQDTISDAISQASTNSKVPKSSQQQTGTEFRFLDIMLNEYIDLPQVRFLLFKNNREQKI